MDEEKYLTSLEEKLIKAERFNFEDRTSFPKSQGCYLAWQDDVIIYVGETKNLHKRMGHLGRTWNHPLRVSIGRKVFEGEGSSTKKFSNDIEKKLDEYFNKKILLSHIEVKLGRKELEEWFIEKYKPEYNTKGR